MKKPGPVGTGSGGKVMLLAFRLSPCIRDRFCLTNLSSINIRLIPVHMRQIAFYQELRFQEWVHPRAYGADTLRDTVLSLIPGSSPCIRGRFTLILFLTKHMTGSSPCIRGRLCCLRIPHQTLRFIPVHTGQILNFPKISEAAKSPIQS